MTSRGALHLVPNLLGAIPPAEVLPQSTIDLARRLRHWVVETPKAARAFLATLPLPVALADLAITPIGDLARAGVLDSTLDVLRHGHDLGLLSDAGCPAVADPGAMLVAAAHEAGLRVVPHVGPSAVVLALMAAGLDGQRFAFHGYLPVRPAERLAALRELESRSRSRSETEVFIETPYRNRAMIASMAEALDPATLVCVAADLTLPTEEIVRATAGSWRRADPHRFDRRPAIFLLLAAPGAAGSHAAPGDARRPRARRIQRSM